MKAINACLLWMAVAIGLYVFCMHNDDYALKYYPEVNELHFDGSAVPKELSDGRIKFVTVAILSMILALPALLVGRLLPAKSAALCHALGWIVLLGGGILMFLRELHRF